MDCFFDFKFGRLTDVVNLNYGVFYNRINGTKGCILYNRNC